MEHPPYHISHLDLHTQIGLPLLDTSSMGHYLVFWWQEIPLGQLFVKPREVLEAQTYYNRVLAAITPALQRYAGTSLAATPIENWLQQQNLAAWNESLASILAPWIAREIPEQVAVSLVICTRNRSVFLNKCLQMVRGLRCRPTEIIVVDNAPTDNSTREVVENFPEVSYCLEARPGLDIARNTGLRQASAPIVAYMDDDVVTHPLWVYRVWETFQQPDTAAMTGLVIASELQTEAQQIFELHWSFNRGYIDKVYNSDYLRKTLAAGPPVWEIGAGANMAFRKEVAEKVGYFDERLDVGAAGCNGDSEMWFRILAHGHTIRYNPLAVVHHEHRRELGGLKKQIFSYMRGFAAAALIQQKQEKQAGYKRHMFQVLPPHYLKLLRRGFPYYRFQHRTLLTEIRGMISGIFFYLRNKNQPGINKQ